MTESGRPRDPAIDDSILEAARALIDEDGLDALSIAGVARRAGVGRPTVYRRYADVKQLARSVFYDDLERTLQRSVGQHTGEGSVIDQLVGLARPFLDYYRGAPERSYLLLELSVRAPEDWSGRFAEQLGRFMLFVTRVFQAGIERGEVRADADLMLAWSTYFALYGTVVMAGANGTLTESDQQEQLLRALLVQAFEGLTPR